MSYNILIVDDDGEYRSELRDCFHEFGVIEASSGEAAIEILKKPNTIDIVLLDQTMSGMKGTDALAEMKEINPGLKIIMLTGSNLKETAITALKNKADEYIEKPMDIGEGRAIIMKLLDEKDSENIPDNGSVDAKIEKVKVFIERNYDKKVSLEDAAGHAGLSPKYLSRAFEEHEGQGFNGFKSGVKLDKALEFLSKGYNVSQISDMLAYENAESFIRAFKKMTGFPPAKYRDVKIKKPVSKGRVSLKKKLSSKKPKVKLSSKKPKAKS